MHPVKETEPSHQSYAESYPAAFYNHAMPATTDAPAKLLNAVRQSPPFGALHQLPSIVLREILRYLHPSDLLNVARTSKALRKLMLRRENAYIWREGLKHVKGLPACPAFMSEPAYAHIIFSATCHGCGAGDVHNVIWSWFVRYCDKCLLASSCTYREMQTASLIPQDALVIGEMTLKEMFTLIQISSPLPSYRFHLPQIDRFVKAWKRTTTYEERYELCDEQGALVKAMKERATECVKWLEWDEERKECERRAALIEQRISDVINKLQAAGWDPEIRYMDDHKSKVTTLRDIPIVLQTSQLTDEEWPLIFDAIKPTLEVARTARLADERHLMLKSRTNMLDEAIRDQFATLPRSAHSFARPYYIDLAFKPECRELIDASASRLITKEDFSLVVPGLVVHWEEECKRGFKEWIKNRLPGIPDDVDPFDLAVAFFSCHCDSLYQTHLRYPAILGHECLRRGDWRGRHKFLCFPEAYQQELINLSRKPKTIKTVYRQDDGSRCPLDPSAVSDIGFKSMLQLLNVLGLDPRRTTFEDLKVHPSRLVLQGPSCWLYNWASVLHHYRPGKGRLHDWKRVEAQDIPNLEATESAALVSLLREALWCCALCHSSPFEGISAIRRHMRDLHAITLHDDLVKDDVMFLHPDFVYSVHAGEIECPEGLL